VVGQAGAVLERPVERGRHRHRLGDAAGLDEDGVEATAAGQLAHGVEQVLAQGAADAAVGQLHQLLLGAIQAALAGDEGGVDVDLAHVVDDHRDLATLPVAQHVVEQRGLACSEEAGEHGDGDTGGGSHRLMIIIVNSRISPGVVRASR
jgi:hypothetical protein